MKRLSYRFTLGAAFLGYVVQATVNTYLPLLFVIFQSDYGIPLSRITLLITVNFCVQLLVDLLSAGFIDKIGYRAGAILAQSFCVAGFILLAVLPDILPPLIGLMIGVTFYAVGGGLLEVIVSPIVEACPTKNKPQIMSILHSFYCWGYLAVACLSALFFAIFGTEHWKILTLLWTIVPLIDLLLFLVVAIYTLNETPPADAPVKSIRSEKKSNLFANAAFWIFFLMMLCAGASEQSVSQWASAFTETALGLDKSVCDLLGPALFAAMMGLSRLLYGLFGQKISPLRAMTFSGVLCIPAYLLLSLCRSPFPILIGMGLSGFSVGILWPCTFSLASDRLKGFGTKIFAFLALAGDLGCSLGPIVAGTVAETAGNSLSLGILAATIFPLLLVLALFLLQYYNKRKPFCSQPDYREKTDN